MQNKETTNVGNNPSLVSKKDSPKPENNVKVLFSGGFAGMISKTCTAPLERVQILNQTGASREALVRTFQRIISRDGTVGLWKGNTANCLRIFPHKSILFSANDWLISHISTTNASVNFLTGAAAGTLATTTTYPIDLIRAQLSGTWDKNKQSIIKVTRDILRYEGMGGFYKGLGVTLIGAFPYEGVRIGAYNVIRQFIPTSETKNGKQPHPIGKLCAGALAGASAGVATYPTDTVRRMLQVQGADGLPKFKGVVDCIKKTFQDGGLGRFYFGLNAKLARVIPDAAILFLAYETLKNTL